MIKKIKQLFCCCIILFQISCKSTAQDQKSETLDNCETFKFEIQEESVIGEFILKQKTSNIIYDVLNTKKEELKIPDGTYSAILSKLNDLRNNSLKDYEEVEIKNKCKPYEIGFMNYRNKSNDFSYFIKKPDFKIVDSKKSDESLIKAIRDVITNEFSYDKKYELGTIHRSKKNSDVVFFRSYLLDPMDPNNKWVTYGFSHLVEYDTDGYIKNVIVDLSPVDQKYKDEIWIEDAVYYLEFKRKAYELSDLELWKISFEPYPEDNSVGIIYSEKILFSINKS